MRGARSWLVVLLALAAAVACVRLGIWQCARWQQKRAQESARRAILAEPPRALADSGFTLPPGTIGRRVSLAGTWERAHAVWLTGRTNESAPGVELARPLRVAGGVVMIERGWLPAEDGVHATFADSLEPGRVVVRGLADTIRRGAGDWAPQPLPGAAPGIRTARWLDADSLARVLGTPVAGWALRELPEPGAPVLPLRLAPEPIDPATHLSYAFQWFLFAAAFAAGAVLVFVRARAPR
jgi:cytochrome oxidase assembly protein ShyY1